MKGMLLFILMDNGYCEIPEWEPFGAIVAMVIHEMMMTKHEPIHKL